nr:immunoglobulin heavy chain junction region [Macaca mulatta]
CATDQSDWYGRTNRFDVW